MAKSFVSITDTFSTFVTEHNNQVNKVGDLTLLGTLVDSDIVGAINSITTLNVPEEVNLYYTKTRVDSDIAAGATLIAFGVTAVAAELNILDGATVTTSELNILDGVTATAAEINKLDGLTLTTLELNTRAADSDAVISNSISLTGAVSAWKFSLSGNDIIISYGATSLAKLSTTGDLTVIGNVTAYGTI